MTIRAMRRELFIVPEEEYNPLKIFKGLFQKKGTAEAAAQKSPALKKFLDWLETLDHKERMKRAINLGKECLSADDAVAAHAKKLVAELEKGSFYERQLALMTAQTSRDSQLLMRFTRDRSEILRRLSCNIGAAFCDEKDIIVILSESRGKNRRDIIKRLRRLRRQAVIDLFLENLEKNDPEEFRSLVYFGSDKLISESLDKVADSMSPDDAARFSYLHAEQCINFLSAYARSCSREDPRLFSLYRRSSKWISVFRPEKTLELIEKLLPLYPAAQLNCEILNLRPLETIKLFSNQADYGGAYFNFVLDKLPDEMILQAMESRRVADYFLSAAAFKELSTQLRLRVFEKCREGWRDHDGQVPSSILELLPRNERIAEARKHLTLPNLSAQASERLSYLRLLDWESIRKEIAEFIDSPDPENRSLGFFHYVYSLKFNREHLCEILDLLHKRKNEPDPVRNMFFTGLAALPAAAFKTEDLEPLSLLISDATKAQDLSLSSLANMGKLLLRLFPIHRKWAATQISTLIRERGPYMITVHTCRLLDSDLDFLSDYFKPALEFWLLKEREVEICQFASWLRLRLPSCAPAVEALGKLSRSARSPQSSERAASILYEWDRKSFAKLVPELLKLDESWSLRPLIYQFLSSKQQDLLTPYLGQKLIKGRFGTGKTRVVPNFVSGFRKWTDVQLEVYSRELCLLIEHRKADHSDRIYGVHRLCRLPEPNVDVLAGLASLDNKDEAVRDFTLRQMADTDNGCALPILLECLNDERARQAIYALRTALTKMNPEQALKLLKSVPKDRVTVFKEVVRLAGDSRSKDAFEWLSELESTELHRDVRVALLRALWNFPAEDRTWEIMRRSVSGGNRVFADTAIRFPAQALSAKARKELLSLYNDALQNEEASTRIKTLNQIAICPILDPEQILRSQLGLRLSSKIEDECRAASWTIGQLYAGRDSKVLAEYVGEIASSPRNLRTFLQQLQVRFSRQPEVFCEDTRAICRVLNNFPKNAELSISLAGAILPWSEFYEMLCEHETNEKLHLGVMQTAIQALSQPVRGSGTETLADIEKMLQASDAACLRRLGLAALCGLSNSAAGWTEERLARLKEYRLDGALVVASAAEFTLPSAEMAAEAVSP